MKKLNSALLTLFCTILSVSALADNNASSECRTLSLGVQSDVPNHAFKIPATDGDFSGFLNCDGPNEAAYDCHGTLKSKSGATKREEFVFSEALFMDVDQQGNLQAVGNIRVNPEGRVCE